MTEVINSIELKYPSILITNELEGIYGSSVLKDLKRIIHNYDVYDKGADFTAEGTNGNYIPADLKVNFIKQIINKTARFMFSKPPDINILPVESTEANLDKTSIIQTYVNKIIKNNQFGKKLLQAARDCFIGERVVLVANFNKKGVVLNFIRSLEFIYDVSEDDCNFITKLIVFYIKEDGKNKDQQRIYKKKYWIEEDGFCHVEEKIFDGNAKEIEVIEENFDTKLEFIPAMVIINEGLSGDVKGESDVELLENNNAWYNRLVSGDIDAERQSMNPIRYTVDIDSNSTKSLSIAAGAYWDLSSDANLPEGKTGQVGTLESTLAYNQSLDKTLDRIKNDAFDIVDMPNVTEMQGKLESGKALKSIYWGLVVRCDEKMLSWKNAIEFIVRTIIIGAEVYPDITKRYLDGAKLPDIEYVVEVENQYSLPDDEEAEKEVDLLQVQGMTMSRKSYMKKWLRLTDTEADKELKQIALEQEQLVNSFAMPKDDNSLDNELEEDDE